MANDPGVLALVVKIICGIQVHVINPLALLVHCDRLSAVVLARNVRPQRSSYIHPDSGWDCGMNDELVVLVQHEEIQVSADALQRVVVVEGRLTTLGVIASDSLLNIGLSESGRDCMLQPVEPGESLFQFS